MTFYHPLRCTNEGIQIRLCSLLPGNFTDPINCHIEAFDLNDGLEFEALSYTWGDAADRLCIEANGEAILVTKNLATALVYLRKDSGARYLWIDAICINQNDIDERSRQVALMGKIYQSARLVVSWIGIRDPFFDPFIEMEHATLLVRHIKFLKGYLPFQEYLENIDSQKPYSGFEDHMNTFNNGLYSLQLLIGEREREKPAYWQRAWIIQEVAAAKLWILQSGSYIISEEDVQLVTEFISSPIIAPLMDGRYKQRKFRSQLQSDRFVPISIYRSLLYPGQEDKEKRIARARGPLEFLALLRHNRSRLCADKRDKVYSILGLSDHINISQPGISVDYSKSISEVYIETVQSIIQSTSSLEILCSANLAETTVIPGLPSWVPNWGYYKSSDTCERPVSYKNQKATGTMPANFRFWMDETTCVLSATGFCFGSILDLEDPFVKVDMANDEPASRMLQYISLFGQLSRAYKNMARVLHPKPLSPELFRHTCSLGLLSCDLNDSFQCIMASLDLSIDSDQVHKGITFSGSRFRLKLMASSINDQCMFAVQQHSLKESLDFGGSIIGVAPPGVVQKGDLVCLLFGCSAPLVLRPVEKHYLLICAAYIDNLMDGSALAHLEDGLFKPKNFDLM